MPLFSWLMSIQYLVPSLVKYWLFLSHNVWHTVRTRTDCGSVTTDCTHADADFWSGATDGCGLKMSGSAHRWWRSSSLWKKKGSNGQISGPHISKRGAEHRRVLWLDLVVCECQFTCYPWIKYHRRRTTTRQPVRTKQSYIIACCVSCLRSLNFEDVYINARLRARWRLLLISGGASTKRQCSKTPAAVLGCMSETPKHLVNAVCWLPVSVA